MSNYKYNSLIPINLDRVDGSAGGAFIPLAGTTVGNPVTGDIELTSAVRIFSDDGTGVNPVAEFKPMNSSPVYAAPWNNLKAYLIGTGNYDTPENWSLLAQSPTQTYITTRNGDGNTLSATLSVTTAVGGSNSAVQAITVGGLGFGIQTAGAYYGYLKADTLTANRTYQLPDVNGTIALLSNLSGYATLTGVETLTNKTLTSPIINVGSDATGDIYYRNSGGAFTRLGIGSTARVLTVVAGIPAWSSALLEGGTSNSALRLGTGSSIGTAFSVAIGVNSGQTGTAVASTVNIGWTNTSTGSANSIGLGTNVQMTNCVDGIAISRSSAIVMKSGSRLIRIGNTLGFDWSADAGAYSALLIGSELTMTGQRSITWVGHLGNIDNTTAGVETDGIVGIGSNVTIKAGRSTCVGPKTYSDGISCTVVGYGAKAKKSVLEAGSFAHGEAYGRGAYVGISNSAVIGGGSTIDFYFGNGWTNRYYDNDTTTIVSYDNALYPTRIHGRDAYDDVDGTSVNQNGGSLEIWGGRSTGTGTGGNIVWKVADGVSIGGNVKQAMKTVGTVSRTNLDLTVDLKLSTVGTGIQIKEGTNARMGVGTLVAGTLTINNTTVTANTRISLTASESGIITAPLRVTGRSNGVSFTVGTGVPTDTVSFIWELKEGF